MSNEVSGHSGEAPDRRRKDLRDTQLWDTDLNGYAICPWCAAMVYAPRAGYHQDKCGAAPPERRAGDR